MLCISVCYKKMCKDRRRREEKDEEKLKRNVLQLAEKNCRSKDEIVERDLKQRRTLNRESSLGGSISDTDFVNRLSFCRFID